MAEAPIEREETPYLRAARRLHEARTVLLFGEVTTARAAGSPAHRNHWLSAEEAVEYGLVSRVLERPFAARP